MHRFLLATVLLTQITFAWTQAAFPQDRTDKKKAAELKTTPDEIPAAMKEFNGMLVGRLAAKDIEKGTFVVLVQAVPRVWRNSKSENPKSIVGKTAKIHGVSGKFLDVLVVTRKGETVEFECQHDGDKLKFPGELLRRVAPYDPGDYPELPEAFRGFKGAVSAKIVKKDPETFEMIVKVEAILDVWDDSKAKKPKEIVGKSLLLAGFWNRKEQYHKMKVGSRIEVGMDHIAIRSDHVNAAARTRPKKDSK